MNNRTTLPLFVNNNETVDPIPLKLAHKDSAITTNDENAEAEQTNSMWVMAISFVFILAIILIISYFVVSRYRRRKEENAYDYYYDEEEYW